AQSRVGRGDLSARGTRTDDDERLRQLVEGPCLLGADDTSTELGSGDRSLDGAGRKDDALRRLDLGAVEVAADLDIALRCDAAVTLDDVDLALLHQAGHTPGEGLDD